MEHKRLVVIGGGAAGFFCAVNAAKLSPNLEVILLEKTTKLLSKVKVSGGGRCNVTHACFDIGELAAKYPRGKNFVKKMFHQFSTKDTIEWFNTRGLQLKTEVDGRMFPVTDASQSVIDVLFREVNKLNVEVRLQQEVIGIRKKENALLLQLNRNEELTADYVCVACGGYPKTAMFEWIQQLGHTIELPVPSLFTFNIPNNAVTALMGISVPEAVVKIAGTKIQATGPILITHWGLSGPAVIKCSAWGARELAGMNYQFTAMVNWVGGNEKKIQEVLYQHRLMHPTQKISNNNPLKFPQRLWQYFLEVAGITDILRWCDLPVKMENKLVQALVNSQYTVSGKTTFKEEFVTAGGVKLSEIDSKTMMSKIHPNLFFAGEIIDVDGITGGFNFQHAWTSGYIVAKTVADKLQQE